MFCTYILYAASHDRYYVGHCEDMAARLARHNRGGVPATQSYRPWNLVYKEEYASRSEAMLRESAIKRKKSRKYIEQLIAGGGFR